MITTAAKKFVTKHNQLVTVVGTMIVFITFVVNDVLRDEASDLADSLNRALISSELRKDTSQILTIAGRTEQMVHILTTKPNGHSSTDENDAWVREGALGETHELASILELAQQADPNDVTLFKELGIVAKQMEVDQQIQTALMDVASNPNHLNPETFAKKIAALFESRPKDPDEFTSIPAFQSIPGSSGGKATMPLFGYQRLQYDSQRLFALVRTKEQQSQQRAKRWKDISFVLYPFGLFLGLAGKLFGADTDAG